MPSVGGESGSRQLSFRDGSAGPGSAGVAQVPGVVEVIFGAGAVNLREFGAVDVKQVISFAEPGDFSLGHAKHGPHVVAGAPDIEKSVIMAAVRGPLLPIVSVKVGKIGRQGSIAAIVDVVIKHRHQAMALVGQGDATGLSKGHGPVAISRAPKRAVAHHHGIDVPLSAVADSEQVAQRSVDARRFVPVIVDTNP
jgi:hypothetical protein